MPCYRQKRFANPIKPERRGNYDKFEIHGSCNNCSGCAKRKQNDWLVRSYFEYMSVDYDCFFVTLDFRDEDLPIYNGVPCFDSKLLIRFFESFRQRVPSFRYLCSSHLGEARHRPHYHVAFLFPRGSYSLEQFWSDLPRYWHYGSHFDISQLKSVRHNPLAAFEYICRYTTYSYKVKESFSKIPYRYRPHTTASPGFGAQAMDPDEFACSRLLRLGVKFFDTPVITKKYLLENQLVYLDIKRDGVLVPFAIPRYYEQKLLFDYSYDSVTKKVNLLKNEAGYELQKIRHNLHYLNLYSEFINSSTLKIHEDHYVSSIIAEVFPRSPYLGMMWSDVVDDVTFDNDSFFDFCKFYNWLMFDNSLPGYYRYRPSIRGLSSLDRLRNPDVRIRSAPYILKNNRFVSAALDGSLAESLDYISDDSIDLYIYAISHFLIWKDVQRHRQAEFEDWKIREEVKKKIHSKAKSDLKFYWHLRRHNFKFYELNPSSYVSHYQIKEDRL